MDSPDTQLVRPYGDQRVHFLSSLGHAPPDLNTVLDKILLIEQEPSYSQSEEPPMASIDRSQLAQFTLHCPVPAHRRPLIWAILMGVRSLHKKADDFVWQQKKESAIILERSANLMYSEKDLPMTFFRMYFIQNRIFLDSIERQGDDVKWRAFRLIAHVMLCVCDSDMSCAYWLTVHFHEALQAAQQPDFEFFCKQVQKRVAATDDFWAIEKDIFSYWWATAGVGALHHPENCKRHSIIQLWEFLIAGGPAYCQELLTLVLVEMVLRCQPRDDAAPSSPDGTIMITNLNFDASVNAACKLLKARHAKFASLEF